MTLSDSCGCLAVLLHHQWQLQPLSEEWLQCDVMFAPPVVQEYHSWSLEEVTPVLTIRYGANLLPYICLPLSGMNTRVVRTLNISPPLQLLEAAIRKELAAKTKLVQLVKLNDDSKAAPINCELRRSIAVAGGAPIVELRIATPAWAAQVT